jgi:hypothetical protein
MKKNTAVMILVCLLSMSIKAQFCNSGSGLCYKEDECFNDQEINTHDYIFSTVKNTYRSATRPVDLYMTIYSPCVLPNNINNKAKNAGCNGCKRPFILLFHAGGFRTGCRTLIANECMEFAKRGYVAASVDYRLGWVPEDDKKYCKDFCFDGICSRNLTMPCKAAYNDSLNFALYRSIQDGAAALRFIAHYADNLHIDTSYLYIGGYSAGAITAINLCYMNQGDLNKAFPKASPVLGPFNNYGNSFTNKYRIAGLFNNWGCIINTIYIKGKNDKIPMIAFHGLDDSIVPFKKGRPLSCPNGAYSYTYGSGAIYSTLVNSYAGLPIELYACYGGHGIFDGNPESDTKALYRIQKAVCFFKRVRNGDKTRKSVYIYKQEDDISYNKLISTSPVSCSYKRAEYNYNATAEIITGKTPLALIVSPNPVTSVAKLAINGKFKKLNIALTDPNGKILWSRENIITNRVSLPTEDLKNGLYLIIVNGDEYSGVIKFLKLN